MNNTNIELNNKKESLARKNRREKAKSQLQPGSQTKEQEKNTISRRKKREDIAIRFHEQELDTVSRSKKREKSTLFDVGVAVVLAVSAIGTSKRKLLFWCVPFLVAT